MTALLGIDLGERRIGVAVADGEDVGARPLVTLRRGPTVDADVEALSPLIDRHDVAELIVGLPIDAAGHEGPQAIETRAWVETIGSRLGEHASGASSSWIGPMRRGRSGGPPSKTQRDAYRARVDREAAAIILQDELDSRRATGTDASRPTMETTP